MSDEPNPTNQPNPPPTLTQTLLTSLSTIVGPLPIPTISHSLLHDPTSHTSISTHLRLPSSGSGSDDLCRWLYDAFQSADPHLRLLVLRSLPVLSAVYLSRTAASNAGFEAVLLAIYAHEAESRAGQPETVSVPDINHSSLYHETRPGPNKNNNNMSTELNRAVVSPALDPCGTVRATRRARIVGVALELYYSRISSMPVFSKIEFCESCAVWPAHWELLQPTLWILAHCLFGPAADSDGLRAAAGRAVERLYERASHEVNPQAMLATRSLLRLVELGDGVAPPPPQVFT
ncbi:hypothetical protein QJS04_geneDACA003500 [Acorus gramineus]|uniref:Hyccin n=1 Tax=Acorus gramineus TaxID=55184 RepID=A0AAV9BNZ8_ACOGR|nr:hypothetical protein QJS04_geneDACA003500 [Acorus gramineus]